MLRVMDRSVRGFARRSRRRSLRAGEEPTRRLHWAESMPLLVLGLACIGMTAWLTLSHSQASIGRFTLWPILALIGGISLAGGLASSFASWPSDDEAEEPATEESKPSDRVVVSRTEWEDWQRERAGLVVSREEPVARPPARPRPVTRTVDASPTTTAPPLAAPTARPTARAREAQTPEVLGPSRTPSATARTRDAPAPSVSSPAPPKRTDSPPVPAPARPSETPSRPQEPMRPTPAVSAALSPAQILARRLAAQAGQQGPRPKHASDPPPQQGMPSSPPPRPPTAVREAPSAGPTDRTSPASTQQPPAQPPHDPHPAVDRPEGEPASTTPAPQGIVAASSPSPPEEGDSLDASASVAELESLLAGLARQSPAQSPALTPESSGAQPTLEPSQATAPRAATDAEGRPTPGAARPPSYAGANSIPAGASAPVGAADRDIEQEFDRLLAELAPRPGAPSSEQLQCTACDRPVHPPFTPCQSCGNPLCSECLAKAEGEGTPRRCPSCAFLEQYSRAQG